MLLLKDEYVTSQIEEHFTDEKYNEVLLVDVEKGDRDKFELAEESRRKKIVMLTVTEEKAKGRGKKKCKILLIVVMLRKFVIYIFYRCVMCIEHLWNILVILQIFRIDN